MGTTRRETLRVADVMTRVPYTVQATDTLDFALQVMWRASVHELPVLDGTRLEGIITERDLSATLGRGVRDRQRETLDAARLGDPVRSWMTPHVRTIHPDTTMADACRQLAEFRVGSMPVVDDDLRLVGILSVTDALRLAARWFERKD